MADLTAKRDVRRQPGEILPFKQAAVKVLEGALVMINAAGYLTQAADTASCHFAGVADKTVDNSAGAAGDLKNNVRMGGVVDVATADTITIANVGDEVFASDNQTVALVGTTTNDVYVGRIVEFVSANKARVALAPFGGKRSDLIE